MLGSKIDWVFVKDRIQATVPCKVKEVDKGVIANWAAAWVREICNAEATWGVAAKVFLLAIQICDEDQKNADKHAAFLNTERSLRNAEAGLLNVITGQRKREEAICEDAKMLFRQNLIELEAAVAIEAACNEEVAPDKVAEVEPESKATVEPDVVAELRRSSEPAVEASPEPV